LSSVVRTNPRGYAFDRQADPFPPHGPVVVVVVLLDGPYLRHLVPREHPDLVVLPDVSVRDPAKDHRAHPLHVEVVVYRHRPARGCIGLPRADRLCLLQHRFPELDGVVLHERIVLEDRALDERGDLLRCDVVLEKYPAPGHPDAIQHHDGLPEDGADLVDDHEGGVGHGGRVEQRGQPFGVLRRLDEGHRVLPLLDVEECHVRGRGLLAQQSRVVGRAHDGHVQVAHRAGGATAR